jgi:selenium metabolism protein YedF
MSTEIDARGWACPQPVIATKKALDAIGEGVVTTIVDNAAAKENVTKLAVSSGYGVCSEQAGGDYYVRITKGGGTTVGFSEPLSRPAGDLVYLITKDTLGHGSDELGAVLVKAFFTTLLEAEPQPRSLLFINSGVKLAVAGSSVLGQLETLAGRGVEIAACGTCLDYFGLKEKLAVGEVSNMYAIVNALGAGRAVTL